MATAVKESSPQKKPDDTKPALVFKRRDHDQVLRRHNDTVVSAIADFVTLTGTDFKVDDARVEAEALQQAPGGKSKYLLNAIEENDSSGEDDDEGTENREEQIVAPPLNSGPEARDTSVDVLRLRRAAQTDSALTRSASWAAKHMDEEEARLHLEEELSKAAKEKLAAAEAANAKEAATHVPRPPQHPPATKNSSPRIKNTSMHPSFSFVQTAAVVDQQLYHNLIQVDAQDAIGEGLLLAGHAFDDQGHDIASSGVHHAAAIRQKKQEVERLLAQKRERSLEAHFETSHYHLPSSTANAPDDDDDLRKGSKTCRPVQWQPGMAIEKDEEVDASNPLQYLPKSHPVHKIMLRLLNKVKTSALYAWLSWHSSHMHMKQRIIDQYVTCCSCVKPKRSPYLRNQLRCWLFKPSEGKLDLVSSGMTSRDVQAIFCALAGVGCGLNADRAVNIIQICDGFGDCLFESVDLSSNDIGADGTRALVDVFLKTNYFRLQSVERLPSVSTAARNAGCITYLDLSRNNLGPSSSKHLKRMLSNPQCSIRTLVLAGNNFGDSGCAAVILGLTEQGSVEHVDLSNNCASTASGHALGAMLPTNRVLKRLDFSFNSLRTAGARAAFVGLGKNKTLETLMMQWNGLGDDDTIEGLARALLTCALKVLDISENRIRLKGASILAATLELGTCLEEVSLDGNKIGQIGARAILAAVQAAAHLKGDGDGEYTTIVSTNNCGANLVDKAAFDPGETAGKYELDLRESYSRTVLVKLIRTMLQGKGNFSAMRLGEKVLNYSLMLEGGLQGNISTNDSVEMLDWCIVTNRGHKLPVTEGEDENGQRILLEGVWAKILNKKLENLSLVVKFSYASLRKRASAEDALPLKSYILLYDGLSATTSNATHCTDLIDTVMGPDQFLTIDQARRLFECINNTKDVRFMELGPVREHFLCKCFHKLVESNRQKELLTWCSEAERKALEKQLGAVSFTFTPNNPTGFHKLDLGDNSQREIATRLTEIRNDFEPRILQLKKFYSFGNRAGGRRETADDSLELERAWRNSKYNGAVLRWTNDWKLPWNGILEVDFVEVTKPDPNDHKDGDLSAMNTGQFNEFVEQLSRVTDDTERVHLIRQYSNQGFFYCRQLAKLLTLVTAPSFKVEICVIGYARTLDWHGYKNLLLNLSIPQVKMLEHRVGYINLFDDIMAVDYYELDLARSSHRWVMQELLHLAAVEPGNNVVECTMEGIDFDVPSGWLKDVPRRGVISFYYCREQRVIEQVFEKGGWAGGETPWFVREDGTFFGKDSWSDFKPGWLIEFCETNPEAGPKPCPQPHGSEWCMAHKMRRIKSKMTEKFTDPKKMFNAMDKDGGGSLDRKELAMGLFGLGIWLHPKELQCLLDILDKDGGGDIDLEEFENFWNAYNFEVAV